MTDPMDAGALRTTATALDPVAEATLGDMTWHTVHDAKRDLRAAADELDRLRAVIENAPHQVYQDGTACPSAYGEVDAICTCWKADTL